MPYTTSFPQYTTTYYPCSTTIVTSTTIVSAGSASVVTAPPVAPSVGLNLAQLSTTANRVSASSPTGIAPRPTKRAVLHENHPFIKLERRASSESLYSNCLTLALTLSNDCSCLRLTTPTVYIQATYTSVSTCEVGRGREFRLTALDRDTICTGASRANSSDRHCMQWTYYPDTSSDTPDCSSDGGSIRHIAARHEHSAYLYAS